MNLFQILQRKTNAALTIDNEIINDIYYQIERDLKTAAEYGKESHSIDIGKYSNEGYEIKLSIAKYIKDRLRKEGLSITQYELTLVAYWN